MQLGQARQLALNIKPPPSHLIGLPILAKMSFDGSSLAPVWNDLIERLREEPADANALLDLSTIALLQGRPSDQLELQAAAFNLQRLFRQRSAPDDNPSLKLLAFMAPGDFMANMPVEFLLHGSNIQLDAIYVSPHTPIEPPPEHDVALVAVTESDNNRPILQKLAKHLRVWCRPVINHPDQIARLTRAGTWDVLKSAASIAIPMNCRIGRTQLTMLGCQAIAIEAVLDGATFPIIARPVSSHAGNGLEKLESPSEINNYLRKQQDAEFYIAPFVDYRSPDGLFRKYRIVLIDGIPFASHMAISSHWMIHYLNAGMIESADKRAEEARFMENFDRDFAVRHAAAFKAISQRTGLRYLPFDCGETKDGRLLVFEVGAGMIVHSMDLPQLFPYKRAHMEKIFQAFHSMLGEPVRWLEGAGMTAAALG